MSNAPIVDITPNPLVKLLSANATVADVRLVNDSEIVDQYHVKLRGIDDALSYTISDNSVSLFPGDEQTVRLEITVPKSHPAGSYPFQVIATSAADPAVQGLADCLLQVEGEARVESRIHPDHGAGRRGRFGISTTNTGTTPLWMTYSGYATRDGDPCRLSFNPGEVQIAAGGEALVQLTVGAKRGSLIGQPDAFTIKVEAEPKGRPDLRQNLQAVFEHRPLVRSVGGLVRVLLLIAVIAAVVIALMAAGGPADVFDYLVHDFPDDCRSFVRGLLGEES